MGGSALMGINQAMVMMLGFPASSQHVTIDVLHG
jgi:hypothetical protein